MKAHRLTGCSLLEQIRRQRPLIHCITNYVTAGDVANMILAAGASPVMADGIREIEDITCLSRALMLNLGTLREESVDAMIKAGKLAARLGHPVVFDPVGAGASAFRTETALQIVQEVPCSLIRGNASEIRTLAGGNVRSCGVDADVREKLSEENQEQTKSMLTSLSQKTGAVIVMTGETDLVVSGDDSCLVHNGHAAMTRITGTGCMLDGILAACLAVSSKDAYFWSAVYVVAAHGICGEIAAGLTDGTGSFRQYFIDAMSRLRDEQVWEEARYEV